MTYSDTASNASRLPRLAQLASHLVHPLDHAHADHLPIGGLDVATVRRMCEMPAFRTSLNRFLRSEMGLIDLPIPSDLMTRLDTAADFRLGLSLLCASRSALIDLVQYCSAMQLYPRIRSCVLKSERAALETVLGGGAFVAALRQAPLCYAALSRRGQAVFPVCTSADQVLATNEGVITEEVGMDRPAHPLLRTGIATLVAFVRSVDTSLARLIALRFAKTDLGEDATAVPVTAEQSAELRILCARRGFSW